MAKLGYKGVDTAELLFEDFPCPAANLVGGVEGRGFGQVMSGLEAGRINIAARASASRRRPRGRRARRLGAHEPPAALASIAIRRGRRAAPHLLGGGDEGPAERCDLEAGMAKLFASESAQEAAADARAPARRAGPGDRRHRRAPLPRHAAHDDRRGHQRDPAHASSRQNCSSATASAWAPSSRSRASPRSAARWCWPSASSSSQDRPGRRRGRTRRPLPDAHRSTGSARSGSSARRSRTGWAVSASTAARTL